MSRLSQLLGYGLQPEPVASYLLTAATVVPDAGKRRLYAFAFDGKAYVEYARSLTGL